MFILVLILKWLYASLVGAEAGEVKFSPNFRGPLGQRNVITQSDPLAPPPRATPARPTPRAASPPARQISATAAAGTGRGGGGTRRLKG